MQLNSIQKLTEYLNFYASGTFDGDISISIAFLQLKELIYNFSRRI